MPTNTTFALAINVAMTCIVVAQLRRARSAMKAMALRRIILRVGRAAPKDKWIFDFFELRMLHKHRVMNHPPTDSSTLYLLRRIDGPHWEVLMHPKCSTYRLAQLERDMAKLENAEHLKPNHFHEKQESINKSALEWEAVDERHTAQLEKHYQVFLRNYTPTKPSRAPDKNNDWALPPRGEFPHPGSLVSALYPPLDVVWQYLVTTEERREKRLSSRRSL